MRKYNALASFRKLLISFLLLTSLGYSLNSYSQSVSACSGIKSEKKRLACFDSAQRANLNPRELQATDKADAPAPPEPSNEAREKADFLIAVRPCLMALKKMDSRVNTGISFRDYHQPLAEIDFELRQLIADPRALYNSRFSKKLIEAHSHYSFAGSMWGLKFKTQPHSEYITVTESTLATYPKARRYLQPSFFGSALINHSDLLSVIWEEASQAINEAESML